MTFALLLQIILSGLAAGAVYGLVGMGYSLIFRMSGVLNFAHGELVSVAIFAFLLAVGGGGAVAVAGVAPAVLLLAVILAVALTVGVAVAMQRFAVAPFLARQSTVGWIAATAAGGLLLRSLVGLRFRAESYSVPDVLPLGGIARGGVVDLPGGGILQLRTVAVLVIALALAAAFDRWLALSWLGRAMQAAAVSPDTSRLVGINPARLQMVAWAIAGLLIAAAGLLLAPSRPVTLELGVIIGLKGTAAAVLGQLGAPRGAVVAGLGIGVLESLLSTPVGGLHDVAALLLLVVLLAAIPGRLGGVEPAVD